MAEGKTQTSGAIQGDEREDCDENLTEQGAEKISADSVVWDEPDNRAQAEQKTDSILDGGCSCFSNAVQDAYDCGIDIEKRAEESKRTKVCTGKRACKEQAADLFSKKKKEGEEKKAEQQASLKRASGGGRDLIFLIERVCLRDQRQEQSTDRAGDCGGKQQKRHGHSGECAIDIEGFLRGQTKKAELLRKQCRFNGLKDAQKHPVDRERRRDGEYTADSGNEDG